MFFFQVEIQDEEKLPLVYCLTDIYHPNIDTSESYDCGPDSDYSSSNVCLNILDLHSGALNLDGIVLGLIFLMQHPNLDDPLSPYFEGYDDIEVYENNVRMYMEGLEVDGVKFRTKFKVVDGVAVIDEVTESTEDNQVGTKTIADNICKTEDKNGQSEVEHVKEKEGQNTDGVVANGSEDSLSDLKQSETHNEDTASAKEIVAEIQNMLLENVFERCQSSDDKCQDTADCENLKEENKPVETLEMECDEDNTETKRLELITIEGEIFLVHKDENEVILHPEELCEKSEPFDSKTVIIDSVENEDIEKAKTVEEPGDSATCCCERITVHLQSDECANQGLLKDAQVSFERTHRPSRFRRLKVTFFKLIYLFHCSFNAYKRVQL